jgi:hypothetical protein
MLVASPCLGYIPKLGLSGDAVRALLKNVISVLTVITVASWTCSGGCR